MVTPNRFDNRYSYLPTTGANGRSRLVNKPGRQLHTTRFNAEDPNNRRNFLFEDIDQSESHHMANIKDLQIELDDVGADLETMLK